MRDRLNSDGFFEVTNEDDNDGEERKVEEQPKVIEVANTGPNIELPMTIEIETDYILTSHLFDWQKLYSEYTFTADQKSWNLRTEHPVIFK